MDDVLGSIAVSGVVEGVNTPCGKSFVAVSERSILFTYGRSPVVIEPQGSARTRTYPPDRCQPLQVFKMVVVVGNLWILLIFAGWR